MNRIRLKESDLSRIIRRVIMEDGLLDLFNGVESNYRVNVFEWTPEYGHVSGTKWPIPTLEHMYYKGDSFYVVEIHDTDLRIKIKEMFPKYDDLNKVMIHAVKDGSIANAYSAKNKTFNEWQRYLNVLDVGIG
jgi:hypothetical protein